MWGACGLNHDGLSDVAWCFRRAVTGLALMDLVGVEPTSIYRNVYNYILL